MAAVAAGAVVMAGLPVFAPALAHAAPTAAPSAGQPKTGESEGQRAMKRAAETGERVEVVGERTEFATTYANPDGRTMRLEQAVAPVRVRDRSGSWMKPDATLETRPDGTIAPKAAAVDLTFSGGGEGDALVKVVREGRSLSLGWPDKLPKPTLDGDSAVYANVLPDVDLRMTATAEGFKELLVVKTPKAAASPELKKVTFSLKAARLKVAQTKGGGMAAVDANANEVFSSPPAQMWDSAGDKTQAAVAASPAARSAASPSASASAAEDPTRGPGPGDGFAELPIKVGADEISVAPDAKMLANTDTKAYPLYIDPTIAWGESERTLLRSDGHRDYGFDNSDDAGGTNGKGVGKCGNWSGYYCGPGYVQRLYYEFAPEALKGKHVLGATFRVTEPWAFQCDPRWVDLVRTNNISSSTSWSTRPAELDLMVDRNVSAGRGSLCDPDQPDAPIDFTDNAAETNENLTETVRDFAVGKFARLTLQVRAHDEGDPSAWKRFKNDAELVVDYVGIPNYPSPFGLTAGTGVACSSKIADPSTSTSPTPQLKAVARTVPGGSVGAQLRTRFVVEEQTSEGWVKVADFKSPTSGFVTNGMTTTASVPATAKLKEGPVYRVQSWNWAYPGTEVVAKISTGSVMCHFKVDTTAPKPPQVTTSTPYTLCTTTSCLPGGGPGKNGLFSFAPSAADTSASIVSYQYRLSSTAPWTPMLNAVAGKLNQYLTPEQSGTQYLEVRAWDTAKRQGEPAVVSFLVKEGDGPVGRWHFDEDSGVAVDSSASDAASRDDATLSAGAVRDARGRRGEIWFDDEGKELTQPKVDKGLKLSGGPHATTAGPVLETRSAYTVSAWARLDSKADHMALVSQDGVVSTPFYFGYEKKLDRWYFGVRVADADDGASYWGSSSKAAPQIGVWTHVAGTYNPSSKELAIYVNGQLQAKSTRTSNLASPGPMRIGAGKYLGSPKNFFDGSVDEVAVWQRVLTPAEVATEARTLTGESGQPNLELVADWNATGATGTTLADVRSGYGRTLTLEGGAALDGDSLTLDGTNGAASASSPIVDPTGSFTVTTKVQLDRAKILAQDIGYIGQIAGQRAADGSSWGLWYELTSKETRHDDDGNAYTLPLGVWHFGRVNKDGTKSWVTSDAAAETGSSVRLTGTFDALATEDGSTVSLYVGNAMNDAATAYTAVSGAGEFTVGKGFSDAAWSHFLPGKVEEIRLWAGAISGSDQFEKVVGND
ncbi:LamG-like jellyroll fold domain-containing protein [Streptomyces sp. NPDC050504]|uniref:LamG domain-containing protein n=1 Tax=Streptomyces sp. NPDC050504 TaxID=3365618 RepID=UPI0037A2C1AF